MLDWINTHGITVGLMMMLYSGVISTLPTADEIKAVRPNADPLSLLVYSKVYLLLHLAASNWAKVMPQLRMLGKNGGSEPKP